MGSESASLSMARSVAHDHKHMDLAQTSLVARGAAQKGLFLSLLMVSRCLQW